MQTEWQTVWTQIRLLYIVFSDMSVQKFRIIMVEHRFPHLLLVWGLNLGVYSSDTPNN